MPKVTERPGRLVRETVTTVHEADPDSQTTITAIEEPDATSDFWERLFAIDSGEWERQEIVLWVYSVLAPGARHGTYLTQLYEPVDPEKLKAMFPTVGCFRLMLKNRKLSKLLGRVDLPVHQPVAPERPAAMVPANGGQNSGVEGQVIALLGDRIKTLEEQVRSNPGENSFKAKLDEAKTLMDLATAASPRPSTTKELAEALAMVSSLQRPPADDFQKEFMRAAMERMFAPPPPPPDPLSQLAKLLEMAKTLGIEIGAGAGPDRKTAVQVIAEAAPMVIEKGTGMLRELRGAMRDQAEIRDARGPAAPGQPGPRIVPIGRPPVSAPPGQPAAAANAGAPDPQSDQWLDMIKRRIVVMMQTGASGAQIVDFVSNQVPDLADQMEAVSRDELEMFFRMDGVLSQCVGLAQFKQVIDDAYEYLQSSDDEAEPAEEQAPKTN